MVDKDMFQSMILDEFYKQLPDDYTLTVKDVFDAAKAGDAAALETVRKTVRMLSRMLAAVSCVAATVLLVVRLSRKPDPAVLYVNRKSISEEEQEKDTKN